MIDQSYRPAERRQSLRLAIDHRSNLRLTLDSVASGAESIQGVTLTDISRNGLMASDAGKLVPGVRVAFEVPLVGWREAEVVWIAENRAGCRFITPLSLEELGFAAAHSEKLVSECPSLAADIAALTHDSLSQPEASPPATSAPSWRLPVAGVTLLVISFVLASLLFDFIG